MSIFYQITNNRPLMAAVFGWCIAQFLKVPWHYFIYREWSIKRAFGSGGMPSSHSAATVAMTIALGNSYGYDSPYFAVSALFAAITMYDAAGVRLETGRQAEIINDLVERLHEDYGFGVAKLKEMVGHTPVQVIVGAAIGLVIGVLF